MAVDGAHNGWRYLVLPYAHQDSLVLNAVVTVSSFHLWMNLPSSDRFPFSIPGAARGGSDPAFPNPNDLYRQVIRDLWRQSDLVNYEPDKKHSIVVTILVLLVGAMVTGLPDFPMLFRMLESSLDAIGGKEASDKADLAKFISLQVNK